MQEEIIRQVKELVRIQPEGIPKYDPKGWKDELDAACYLYALDIHLNKFCLLGDFIGKTCNEKVSDQKLINTFFEEIKFLGFDAKEVDVEYSPQEGEKKIYLQRSQLTGEYHFLRQDDDGIWSHKFSWDYPHRKDTEGNIIYDPECMVEVPFLGWCFALKKTN